MTFQRRRARPVLSLLAMALSLSACGGDNGSPTASADTGIAPSAITAAGSYLHMQRNRVDEAGNAIGQDIVLIDAGTNKAVWQQAVVPGTNPVAVRAFATSADGLTLSAAADTALYYPLDGKLFELPLQRGGTPTPRQVSAEAAACAVVRAVPTTGAATLSWLLVDTAGADGSCATAEDNTLKLVRSDAATSVAALAWPGSAQDAIDVHRDAAGTLTQLIAFNPGTGQLQAVSAQDGGVRDVVNGALGTSASVAFVGRAAGRRDQVYLSVASNNGSQDTVGLYSLTWTSDTTAPTLSAAPVASLRNVQPFFARTDDASAFYYVDGVNPDASVDLDAVGAKPAFTVYAIDKGASTVRAVGTLPVGVRRVLPGGALTSSALVLPVFKGQGVEMLAVAKAGGVRSFDLTPNAAPMAVEARQGDDVVISLALDVGGSLKSLWRASVAPGTGTVATSVVSTKALLLGATRDPAESLSGESANPALVWCEASVQCKASGVRGLQLASSADSLTLGSAGLAAFEWSSRLIGDTIGTTVPLSVGTQQVSGLWASDSLWLLDATQAGSLRQVTLLP